MTDRHGWKARETSAPENGSKLRARLGLQFFAEDGEGTGGTDTDGVETDGFLDGLGVEESGSGEDQIAAADAEHQETEPGGEDQTAGQAGNGDGNTEGGEEPQTDTEPPAQGAEEKPPVTLRFLDRQFSLPGDAVEAMNAALGMDACALLQKGFNYDNKGAREMGILSRYAALAGKDLPAYISYLENELPNQELTAEVETLRAQYPETSDAVLSQMAQTNLALRKAEWEKVQAAAREAATRETERAAGIRESIRRQMEQIRQEADRNNWNEYVQLAGITDKSQIPQELIRMVQTEKISPVMAYYKMQAAAARQEAENARKEIANRRQTPGSLSGRTDEHDDFLSGLFG